MDTDEDLVIRREFLALKLKRCAHYCSLCSGRSFSGASHAHDVCFLEDLDVEIYRLFGLILEHQEGRDFLFVSCHR